ncbi:MAG: amidohydrolase family protein [Gemmatimonadetes bacterium]|nr:amidohydrolase family protein [Gemmatimonadota bacterium]
MFVVLILALLWPSFASAQPGLVWPDSIRAPMKTLEFTTSEGTWISVDVSPDGRTIAFDLLGKLYEMPIAGGPARAITRGRSYDQFPRYSPDGTKILFTSDRTGRDEVWLLHRGTDSLQRVSRHDYRAFQGNWSRDGRFVYHGGMDLGARFAAYRVDLHGSRTEFANGSVFAPPTQLNEHPRGKVYYSQPGGGALYQGGFQIKSYDLETGEIAVYRTRPGGASDPRLSPDGNTMAYIHRDDRRTALVLHDMATQRERVLTAGLDRDRMESGAGTTYGVYPNYSWTPDGREIVISYGGTIHALNVATGAERPIPFEVRVERRLAETIKVPVPIPSAGTAAARSYRWGTKTDQGAHYEALGDLYLKGAGAPVNLTRSRALETNPTYDPRTKTVYYASWTDDSLGSVWSLVLGTPAQRPTRLVSRPAQYGGLSLSRDGRTLAFLRGQDDLNHGEVLESQDVFDLVLLGPDRQERVLTKVEWKSSNPLAVRNPPAVDFDPDGGVFFTELERDTLRLKSIRLDGTKERTLYHFPHGARATVSPDGRWIAFREYFRSYLTPFAYAGKPITVSATDKQGVALKVGTEDGEYLQWSPDSRSLSWTRGGELLETDVADVVAAKAALRRTDLTVSYQVAKPTGLVALTGARVITMDGGRQVHERATILVRDNVIEAVGPSVAVPAGARVFDLQGKTVMPGIIDAHGHYNPDVSTLNTLEQNHVGLVANLAYGTTTLYEVYGNHLKDFLASDLQRSGAIAGSRLLSVGPPIYGLRQYRPKSYRPILSQADADEVVSFNKAFGATALKDYVQFHRGSRIPLYDAARRMGVNVVAETAVDFQMNWSMLMDGVSGLEHTVGLTPLYRDVHELWKATGAGNTPTLVVVYNGPQGEGLFHQEERLWEDEKLLRFFPKDYLIRFRRPTRYFGDDNYAVEMARELHKLAQSGVSIHISGHGQMHGLDKHWEMELLARGGFTPLEVIATATINSAKYLGLDQQLGSIEPGKLADLVILDANPLERIRNARAIDMVMQNGVLYRGADASRLHPNPEPAGKQYWFRGSLSGSAGIDRHEWSR